MVCNIFSYNIYCCFFAVQQLLTWLKFCFSIFAFVACTFVAICKYSLLRRGRRVSLLCSHAVKLQFKNKRNKEKGNKQTLEGDGHICCLDHGNNSCAYICANSYNNNMPIKLEGADVKIILIQSFQKQFTSWYLGNVNRDVITFCFYIRVVSSSDRK